MLALDQDAELSRLADDEVLSLASELCRIVITHNVRDFAVLARSRAEEQRSHTGIVLVTLPHTAYGAILRRLDVLFTARPDQDAWIDRVEFLG